MKPKHVLHALLFVTLLQAAVEARAGAVMTPAYAVSALGFGLLSNFLGFYWYRLDSEQRLFRRSRWLSTAVVTLTPLAIPYYMVRSRPQGEKLRALRRYLGFVLLLFVAAVLGGLAGI